MKKILYGLIATGLTLACEAQTNNEKQMNKEQFPIQKTEEQWKAELSPEEYRVLREAGTERAGTGEYYHHHEDGTYTCGACGHELFKSDHKYNSGSGWPSFDRAIAAGNVLEKEDRSYGMVRTEVLCARCGSHLGHLFNDGPRETTGQRYCINSLSLDFVEAPGGEKENTDR